MRTSEAETLLADAGKAGVDSLSVPIPHVDPGAFFRLHRAEVLHVLARVVDSGWYILGDEVRAFEKEFAQSVGVAHAIGVANGTDALALSLRALGVREGDRVATVSHTAVATVAAIRLVGAQPVFVDISPGDFLMDAERLEIALSEAPPVKVVVVVHLYGQVADVPALMAVAHRHGALVVEDCAQAHGASLNGRAAGSMGALASFSFYPTKNLGALGDAGMVVTDDPALADQVRMLREYGWRERFVSEFPGQNSRLDALQGALLRLRLPYLPASNQRRAAIADAYRRGLQDSEDSGLELPTVAARKRHVFHQYVVRHPERDRLRAKLSEAGISTGIHYPVPVHLQPAYREDAKLPSTGLPHTERAAHEVLSLPMFAELGDVAVERVIDILSGLLK
jgi:dTDP-4-amino-4,6-dideoxygalactose transaminase